MSKVGQLLGDLGGVLCSRLVDAVGRALGESLAGLDWDLLGGCGVGGRELWGFWKGCWALWLASPHPRTRSWENGPIKRLGQATRANLYPPEAHTAGSQGLPGWPHEVVFTQASSPRLPARGSRGSQCWAVLSGPSTGFRTRGEGPGRCTPERLPASRAEVLYSLLIERDP